MRSTTTLTAAVLAVLAPFAASGQQTAAPPRPHGDIPFQEKPVPTSVPGVAIRCGITPGGRLAYVVADTTRAARSARCRVSCPLQSLGGDLVLFGGDLTLPAGRRETPVASQDANGSPFVGFGDVSATCS